MMSRFSMFFENGVFEMSRNFKHFTIEDRIQIATALSKGESFRAVAELIGKRPSSVSEEVRRHLVRKQSGGVGRPFNDCINRFNCKVSCLCREHSPCFKKYCRNCTLCRSVCTEYVKEACMSLLSPPYVCGACQKRKQCTLEKAVYDPTSAHAEASALLSESRQGITASDDELMRLNEIISPRIKQGQSVYHIWCTERDSLMCSEKTIYNYIDQKHFDAINLDLSRKVRRRPASQSKNNFKVNTMCRVGRGYSDFTAYIKTQPDTSVVEIDSVIGRVGGKVMLTVHFPDSLLMLIFLRDANTAKSVTDIFQSLCLRLGHEEYIKLFPIILTDNGSEFTNPDALELADNGNRLCRVFYCEPSSPCQKGSIENNHEQIRKVLPKGTCFDNLEQSDMQLLSNHINSLKRRKLNGRSAYETFSFLHGKETLRLLGVSSIAPADINLTPTLLHNRQR